MKGHIYSSRPGDDEIISKYVASFEKMSDEELREAYSREKKLGLVGVRQQVLYLIALREVMQERFKESPVLFENDSVSFGEKDR